MAHPAQDRRAILAMQGELDVDFTFDETPLPADGQGRMKPQRSGGRELVVVVEDTSNEIVLQYMLVKFKNGRVTKH